MTQKNLPKILEEADKRSPDMSYYSAGINNKAYVMGNNLTASQAKAVQNYQRRIYDAWSVLRATNVLEKVGKKTFRYNSRVLEGGQEGQAEGDSDTISADKLRRILQSINSMESI